MKSGIVNLKSFALLLLLSAAIVAQEPPSYEYGQPSELRGLKRVFVDTGADIKTRNSIVKEIRKKLPTLIIAETKTDAEVFLIYASATETRVISSRTTTTGDVKRTTPVYDSIKKGTGYVAREGERGSVRMLLSFEGANDHLFAKSPEISFARAFIKAFKEANADLSDNPYYKILTGPDKKKP